MPGLPSRSASNERSDQCAAIGHGVDGVDDQVDHHLLQFSTVHQHQAAGPVLPHHLDFGLVQEVLHQRQAIQHDTAGRVTLDIAGIFLGTRELQQLGDDLADAVNLFVDQPELDLRLVRLGADHAADHIQRLPCITAIGLLISCATPAVISPMARAFPT